MVGGYLFITVALGAYSLASGISRYTETGNPYPGALVSIAEPVGWFTASLSSALCLAALVHIVGTSPLGPDNLIEAEEFRVHLMAERISLIWLGVATAMIPIQAASDSGVTLAELVSHTALFDCIAASETSRGWIVGSICALVVTVTLRFITRWLGHVVLIIPTLIGVIAPVVTGNAGQGPDHDYATSAAMVFSVAASLFIGLTIVAATMRSASSQPLLAVRATCGLLAVTYGAALLYLFHPGWAIGSSGFGRLALATGIFLALVGATDCWAWVTTRASRRSQHPEKRSYFAALAMMAAMAGIAALAVQPAPRFLTSPFTAWDVFLGYELPQPPNALNLFTVWRFDVLLGTAGVILAGSYTVGFIQLRRRGHEWPRGRLVAWLIGCGILVFTSSSGLRAYGSAMFSVHMAEHMTLNMFIPVLLALGGPVTLALRVLPAARDGQHPGPREWLAWLMHSPVTAYLSHPITAFILFIGSPYIVYFTPLFDTLVRYHWGHEFMAVHFLVVGYLFYWAIIGIDPGPRRLPYPARIGLLFTVMPFHAFFGIALMTMTSAVGNSFYRSVHLPWLDSITADQHLGGAIAWGATELPIIIVIVALVTQWARQDRRAASRHDRHADSAYGDDDLGAYNAMLHELSRMRR